MGATGPLRLGDLFDPRCPTRQLLDRLGGKWTSMAVKVLDDGRPGEIRFAELKRRMPGISQKMRPAVDPPHVNVIPPAWDHQLWAV